MRWRKQWHTIRLLFAILVLRLCCLDMTARAQEVVAGARKIAFAARVERVPKLDRTLDDPLWQDAKPISEFVQKEPTEGQIATERTEVRVLYTQHGVFFGIYCYDEQPSQIVANESRRDVSQDLDNHFEILIDSRDDRRNAYLFEFNPLGTQLDGFTKEANQQNFLNNINGADFDTGWDRIWTTEARINKDGWSVTVAIPFSTLNFTKSNNVIWGPNFKRFIRRKNEEDFWTAWRHTWGITKVSEAGELHGITNIGSGRLFIVKPYLLWAPIGSPARIGTHWIPADSM